MLHVVSQLEYMTAIKDIVFLFCLLTRRANNVTDYGNRSVLGNDTEHMLVEYGLPLPVLVTESLAMNAS